MKRKELDTIIRKIQNRCYLEEPTRITYHKLKDSEEIAFKVFFDSLCIPENLRIDSEKIQNNFSVANCYEFSDDFRILCLNQDEGYVEFVPDCQKFHIVDTYKKSKELDQIKKESSNFVYLAGKHLNEAFAKSKKYILLESENEEIVGDPTVEELKKAKEVGENDNKELEEKDIFVISSYCSLFKGTLDIFQKALEMVGSLKDANRNALVLLAIPKLNGRYYKSTVDENLSVFNQAVQKALGHDSFAALAVEGNRYFSDLLNKLDVKNVYYLTKSAKQTIQECNFTKILNASEQPVDNILDDSEATETFSQLVKIVDSHIANISERIEKFDKKLTLKKAVWENVNQAYQKIKDRQDVKNTTSIYSDLFGNGAFEECKKIAEERQKFLQGDLKNAQNIAGSEELEKMKQRQEDYEAQIQNLETLVLQAVIRKSLENTNSDFSFFGMQGKNQTKLTYSASSIEGDDKPGKEKETKDNDTLKIDIVDIYKDFIFNTEKAKKEGEVPFSESFLKMSELIRKDATFGDSLPSNDSSSENEDSNEDKESEEEQDKDSENTETEENSEEKASEAETKGSEEQSAEVKTESVHRLTETERLMKIFAIG